MLEPNIAKIAFLQVLRVIPEPTGRVCLRLQLARVTPAKRGTAFVSDRLLLPDGERPAT